MTRTTIGRDLFHNDLAQTAENVRNSTVFSQKSNGRRSVRRTGYWSCVVKYTLLYAGCSVVCERFVGLSLYIVFAVKFWILCACFLICSVSTKFSFSKNPSSLLVSAKAQAAHEEETTGGKIRVQAITIVVCRQMVLFSAIAGMLVYQPIVICGYFFPVSDYITALNMIISSLVTAVWLYKAFYAHYFSTRGGAIKGLLLYAGCCIVLTALLFAPALFLYGYVFG